MRGWPNADNLMQTISRNIVIKNLTHKNAEKRWNEYQNEILKMCDDIGEKWPMMQIVICQILEIVELNKQSKLYFISSMHSLSCEMKFLKTHTPTISLPTFYMPA